MQQAERSRSSALVELVTELVTETDSRWTYDNASALARSLGAELVYYYHIKGGVCTSG